MKNVSDRHMLAAALVFALAVAGSGTAQTKSKSKSKSVPRVPVGTEMKIRLHDEIDSKTARSGDKFTATVLDPAKYADSTLEGHIANVNQSGKVKGKTQLGLVFDRIRYASGGSAVIGAQLVRLYGDNKSKVDEEGNVESGSRGSSTAKRGIGGAIGGAIIGGIAGGGSGAAIGSAVGGGVGVGSNAIRGSSKVKLERGEEMLIRTTR
ncbi:MAG TPA: hypothetical protein VFC61_04265 [Blastocatellia bacterium]|nr:hypothetical protein [Blastocatellia bacterium]